MGVYRGVWVRGKISRKGVEINMNKRTHWLGGVSYPNPHTHTSANSCRPALINASLRQSELSGIYIYIYSGTYKSQVPTVNLQTSICCEPIFKINKLDGKLLQCLKACNKC